MNKCKDCKWWGAYTTNVCDAPQGDLLYTGGRYSCNGVASVKDPASFAINATAADDTDLNAELVTGPEFGCSRFTPKSLTP